MRGRQPQRNTESSADDSATPSPNAQASQASSANGENGRAGARKSPSGGEDGDAQLMSSIQRLLLAAQSRQTRNEKGNQDSAQHVSPTSPLRVAAAFQSKLRGGRVVGGGGGGGGGGEGEGEGEGEGMASAAEVEELKAKIRKIQDLHEVEMREAHQMVVQAHAAASTQQGTHQATLQAPSGRNRTPSSGSYSQKPSQIVRFIEELY